MNFHENNITFKKHYYYDGLSVKKVKFYDLLPADKTQLAPLIDNMKKIDGVIATEINSSQEGKLSIQIYHQLIPKKKLYQNDKSKSENKIAPPAESRAYS